MSIFPNQSSELRALHAYERGKRDGRKEIEEYAERIREAAEGASLAWRDWLAGCANETRWKEVEAAHIKLRDTLGDLRPCTCHPDDSPPRPCPRKFALSECREATKGNEIGGVCMAGDHARDWPEDAAHENGRYQCQCIECGNLFVGHKRRHVCRLCAAPEAAPAATFDLKPPSPCVGDWGKATPAVAPRCICGMPSSCACSRPGCPGLARALGNAPAVLKTPDGFYSNEMPEGAVHAVCCELSAARSSLSDSQKWIPVSERLPEVDTFVLAHWRDVAWTGIAKFDPSGEWLRMEIDEGEVVDADPSHWMPLPEAPK